MTAPVLLGYICAALLLQVGVAIAFALSHRRKSAAGEAGTGSPIGPRVSSAGGSAWREFRVARREYEDTARTQCSFYLEPVDGAPLPPFTPGQFLTFTIPVSADRAATRCYSLSDRPNPKNYRITVKRIPAPSDRPGVPPGVSSNHFHDRVHEGDVLQVKAPSGHFCVDPDANVPVVLIAGGVGITPMMSMLQWCLSAQPERTVHLYYGLRNSHEHAFKSSLEELARSHPRFHLNVVYSKPGADDQQGRDYHHLGHANIELLRRTLPHGRHQFYVCGPPAMMESLIPALSQWGVPAQDIHYEAFGPASVRSARSAETALRAPPANAFHQELIEQDCMACHSEHQGVRLTERNQMRFSHALLRTTIRERCAACHQSPGDSLHRQIKGNCAQCHSPKAWMPATFDHAKLFVLDRDHNTECATCHVNSDFSHYTCYGCHEHQPARIRAEHLEEGIRDFEDCVKCHRNASEEPEGRGSREGRERD